MQAAESSFDGIAFHCYEGNVTDQTTFTSQYPNTPIYLTECTGDIGTDFWSDVKVSGPLVFCVCALITLMWTVVYWEWVSAILPHSYDEIDG